MKTSIKKLLCTALAAVCAVSFAPLTGMTETELAVSAATIEDYPVTLVQLGTYDGGSNIAVSGTAVVAADVSGAAAQSFRFDYVGADGNGSYFRIVNAGTGKALGISGSAGDGADCVMTGVSNAKTQLWYISAVQNDSHGQGLYYKIASCADSGYVLANDNGKIRLSGYSGDSSQKWLLNTAGLQGFAGYGKTLDGSVKSSTIGGLLGEVVEVSTFDELKDACEKDDEPRTIIITDNISKTGSYYTTDAGRYYWFGGIISVHDNKTIIGSYDAHALYNVNFGSSTSDGSGHANNVIIRNIELSHDKDLNHHNVWDFADGYNFWVDHCTFLGHEAINQASSGQVDWDKFLCFYDGSDHVTISDCDFGRHEYGILLGWPGDSESDVAKYDGTPCVTLADNYFHDTLTRAPGLMRYGYFHSLNNFVYNFDMGYTLYTDCRLFAEQNYYDAGSQKGSVVNDTTNTGDASSKYPGKYSDEGSYHANGGSLANKVSTPCTWRPSSNYSYKALTAQETKSYTMENAGAKSAADKVNYCCLDHNWAMENTAEEAAVLDTAKLYAFRNVGSGLFLEVENGTAASGTNVQQGSLRSADIWSLEDAGDGYYYLYTQADPKGTLCLDVPYGSADNGTSLGIWTNDQSDARKFRFIDNGDGSYTIVTKSSGDAGCLAVASDSVEDGADVIQWTRNGGDAQKWVPVVKSELLNGEIITELDRLDSDHAESWSIEQKLAVGALLYGDRETTYAEIPDVLLGAEYIRPACDSKTAETDLAVFTASSDAVLYVALDARVTNTPAWLSGWTKSDLTIISNTDVTFKLYQRTVTSGEEITLGTNGQSDGCVQYTVIAVPERNAVKGDADNDGKVSVADVVMLQKWLLCSGGLTNWKNVDMNEDNVIDVFDLVLLKRQLLNK